MSAYDFKEMLVYQVCNGGNMVAERLMQGNKILGLFPIEWQRVSIRRDERDMRLRYDINCGAKPNVSLSRDKVFHVKGPSSNGMVGMSILEYASSAVRLGYTYEKFGHNFYKNGATPSGIFKHDGILKKEAYERLREQLQEECTGLAKAGKPILAENGLDFQPLSMKLVDAELLGSKKFQIEDICRFCRVPLHLVQNLDKATNNNIEHQSLEFAMYTMLPWAKRVEEAINTQLLTPQQRSLGYYFEMNMSALLRGDTKSMAESFAMGIQWGWYSINDVRRMLNLNPAEGGDVYLRPLNMVPIGMPLVDESARNQVNAVMDEFLKKGA